MTRLLSGYCKLLEMVDDCNLITARTFQREFPRLFRRILMVEILRMINPSRLGENGSGTNRIRHVDIAMLWRDSCLTVVKVLK